MVALIIFAVSILLVFHAYAGYPLTLLVMAKFRKRAVEKRAITPPATLIIAAANEGKRIREKLENTLALDYPRDRLQIIVASDGSTDGTNGIVEEYAGRGIGLLRIPERRGKENAQKEAIRRATGEVIVFSDVATRIEPDGLRQIVANFADRSVGCVSSVDKVIGQDGKPGGEGAYVRYEMCLRRLESQVNSLVGLSGSFFAARREVCRDFSGEMQSDFRTLLNSMRLGLRGVHDPDAVGFYLDVSDGRREFGRKVRTVLRGLTVFFRHLEFLNPLRYGLFSYQYCCHKLLRWFVPFFLLAALASNIILAARNWGFLMVFILHIGFYAAAFSGLRFPTLLGTAWFKVPTYFLLANAAIAAAWWKFIRGQRMVMWTPSIR